MESKLTNEIYTKYPKVWDIIATKCNFYSFGNLCYYFSASRGMAFFLHKGIKYAVIPFNLLYALLEDFFMDNGVIIIIDYMLIEYVYKIFTKNPNKVIISSKESRGLFWKKNEAKYQAIIKACEILNKHLEG